MALERRRLGFFRSQLCQLKTTASSRNLVARILGSLRLIRPKSLSVVSAFAVEESVKTFIEAGTPISKTKLHKPRASTRPQTNVSRPASHDDNAVAACVPTWLPPERQQATATNVRFSIVNGCRPFVHSLAQRRRYDNMSREKCLVRRNACKEASGPRGIRSAWHTGESVEYDTETRLKRGCPVLM